MTRFGKLLSYPNVVSTLALIVATSGSAYAVSQLPVNSVGTPQLQTSAVTGPKIKNGSVGLAKLAPGVLPVSGSGAVQTAPGVLPGCAEKVLATRKVTPTKPSRLVVLGTGKWQFNGGSGFAQILFFGRVWLGDAVVGSTASTEEWATETENTSPMGISVAGSPIVPEGTRQVVLQANKTYRVDLVANVNGTCAHVAYSPLAELTTILTPNVG